MIHNSVREPLYSVLLYWLIVCKILTVDGLPFLPDSARVETEVLSLKPDQSTVHFVEEFIDNNGANIHLKISNINRYGDDNDLTSYYRIKAFDDGESIRDERSIVAFNHKELRCTKSSLDAWHLADTSKMLDILLRTTELNVTTIKKDPLAIGPTSLMQIVVENAAQFILELKAFDDTLLGDMYYFKKILSFEGGQKMLIVAQIPMFKVQNRETLKFGKTLLSEIEVDSQPKMISIILESTGYFIDGPNKLNSKSLMDSESNDLVKLMVFYSLFEERAASRHMGSNLAQTSEDSPFSLPAGLGCGMVSAGNLFYVGATQFSGFYEAKDSTSGEMYIAFDEQSGHLRLDSLGRYKMIHNLKDKRITYVKDPLRRVESNATNNSSTGESSYCASEIVADRDDLLYSGRTMKEILGLDEETGLMYLGTQRLEDGTPCFVFERDIDFGEIPLISDLNMRLKAFPTQRLILTYYLVDEISVGGQRTHTFDKNSYESFWLKRIELSALSSFDKYKYLNSRVTFSTSAWSLDIQRGQVNSLHPSRTFDILECAEAGQSVHLEFVLEGEMAPEKNASLQAVGARSNQLLEESVLEFLGRRTSLPRSQLNSLDLDIPDSSTTNIHALVKVDLVGKPSKSFMRSHIGWLKSIRDLPAEAWKTPNGPKRELNRRECSMALATDLSDVNNIHMLFCRKSNCGYLSNSELLNKIDYVKKTQQQTSGPTEYQDPCEIHLLQNIDSSLVNRLRPKMIEGSLNKAEFSLSVTNKVEFRGQVRKVTVSGKSNLNSIGSLQLDGSCFTDKTSLSLPERKFKVNLIELALGKHHSLIYCHKACLFQSGCTTYSYSKSSRVCTLTNVPQSFVVSPNINDNLFGLKKDTSCAIYSLNAIHLYKQKPEVLMTSMANLSLVNYYFEPMTLDDCASLCHSMELTGGDKNLRCHGFFRFDNICAIHDSGNRLFERRMSELNDHSNALANKISYFIGLLGDDKWQQTQHCYQYERDYLQYYVLETSTKLELGHDDSRIDQQSTRFSLVKSSTIYDLDYEACLRECTLVKPECVIVDYCFQPVHQVPTRMCNLYQVEPVEGSKVPVEILVADISERSSLNDLDVMHFVEKLDSQKNIKKASAGCKHHRLTGDNLMFKRQIARFQSKGDSLGNSSLVGELESESTAISQKFLTNLQAILDSAGKKVNPSGHHSDILFKSLAALLGLATGVLAFMSIPSELDRRLHRLQRYLGVHQIGDLFRARRKSSSLMEINEMNNIGA